MRRGECCGLKWCDIDWEQRSIHICRNAVKVTDEDTLNCKVEIRFLIIFNVLLGSGEINHSGSGENRQFWSNENHQSGVASPQVVLFTRPAAGQPVSQ